MSTVTRTLAFFSKWMAEIVRQPALMFALVIGPFLVLLAFGTGVNVGGPRPDVIVVEPQQEGGEIQPLPEELSGHVHVVGSTTNLDEAREQLRQGKADAVAVLPPDPVEAIEKGEQIPLRIYINEIDPVTRSYTRAYLGDQVADLNQKTIAKAIGDAQGSVAPALDAINQARPFVQALQESQVDLNQARTQVSQINELLGPLSAAVDAADNAARGVSFVVPGIGRVSDQTARLETLVQDLRTNVTAIDQRLGTGGALPTREEVDNLSRDLDELEADIKQVQAIPPEVLSEPFDLQLENTAPFVPTFTGFYAPAVIALLLQHLAITLGALSMARVRIIGLMDFLRVAPVKPSEVVFGNYLSYSSLCGIAGGLLFTLSIAALDVPVFGPWAWLVLGAALLIVASLGIGFFISMISSTEQQAAQIAMLILLASIFFGGFVFSLDRISWPARAVSYLLPSTYGIRLFQDVMLRGVLRHPMDLYALAAMMAVFFALTLFMFRREFRPAE